MKIIPNGGLGYRHANSNAMLELLGLPRGSHLPPEGMPARLIQGVMVWVMPQLERSDGRKRSTHRLLCKCPQCGQQMSVGRLHMHRCVKAKRKTRPEIRAERGQP